MPSLRRAVEYLFHNRTQFLDSAVKNLGFFIPDKPYLQLRYRINMGYWPDFQNPKTFNEKLNWLKLNNKHHEYTTLVDKYSVKEYVAEHIGKEYVIPTLSVWDSIEDIDLKELPDSFVLKTTHGGGGNGVVICESKSSFCLSEANKKLKDSLHQKGGIGFREYPYYKVKKRIIAETLLESINGDGEIHDYKFFCFNGRVRCFKVDFGRFVEHHANYYDENCQLLPFGEVCCAPDFGHLITIPSNIKRMIKIAEILSKDISFVRVDLYNVDGLIYFGEMTFFPAGGMGRFTDDKYDRILGNWLEL